MSNKFNHAFALLLLLLISSCQESKNEHSQSNINKPFAIVIHGGAGYITPERIDGSLAQAYQDTINLALEVGYAILEQGGSSVDAVQAAISILEDCTLFNAGRGAVYNSRAQQEMDASIMDGKTLNSGAVAGVRFIKNPIKAARLVMDSSTHVMLSGKGAEILAASYGIELADSAYFYDQDGYNSIQERIKKAKHGTVGAVAIDQKGNIAAATSTGGMFNKKWNRIGDSPIIGAGTYANNKSCGISCTGTGEYFIRTVAAHEVSNLVYYKDMGLKEAMGLVLNDQIKPLGGEGGMIGIDSYGQIAWEFNTPGMFRGYKSSNGTSMILLFGN